ncbi:MAG: hypothetical protein JMN27_09570 [gamma proteobacterium endosymbiont of Lamellibrachia anaximandri]|nr:hypothetical protein [gamma proteobacterium endosymbiont of Lamellibrachia anaximandri]MBL3534068.1 hypothetical protein [gamma proteobacterium endosymbiont of Lamellibrachia anaximandri]
MNIVVTTGCPHSGWETAFPALRQLGLEEGGDTFADWHDKLFQETDLADPVQLSQSIQPSLDLAEKAAAMFSEGTDTPILWADSRSLWLLDFWATTFPQARFLLFYIRAESALAHALRQGVDPERFMEAWHASNQVLIRFQRRNRRRSLLLDAETTAQQPEALADACQRIGLVLRQENPSPTLTTTAPALERLLASQFLREQSALQALQMELEAGAQPLGETTAHEPPQPLEVYHSYQQGQVRVEQLTQARDEQAKLARERQDQIQQLTKVRDEQAKLATEYQAQLTQSKQAQEKLESANEEAGKENELLLLQLHQVQEELEAVFLQKQQIDQAQKEQDTKLKQLQRELDQTRKDFQVEEKIRKGLAGEQQKLQTQIESLTKGRDEQAKLTTERQTQLTQAKQAQEKLESANEEAGQENELLLLQLHQVQEELEAVFLQKQQIDQSQKEQDAKLKQLQRELDQTRKDFQVEEKIRKGLAGEQQKLQTQIESLTKGRDEQAKLATERQGQLTQAKQSQEKLESAKKETEQENELLLLQLHQVQEELEHYFIKYQDLVRELEEQTKAESSSSEEQRESEKSKPAKTSKITTPIRALAKPFRLTNKARKREKVLVNLLKDSGLFDESWYLAEYPDVAEAGIDPIQHYLRYGASEGRNPSPKFDTTFYLTTNPDIAQAEINPLIHYLRYGKEEGRLPSLQGISAWTP